LHWAGGFFYYDWFSGLALLPILGGVALTLAGRPALRWCWPGIAFLFFMLPLPFSVEHALAFPLQQVATRASTYVLQTLGFPAVAEGNVIIMEESRIGVVEACNGLGMLVSFFALTTAVAMVIERHWLVKVFLILSAVPIALLANMVRIAATGIVAETVGMNVADQVFHGVPGWFIMPLLALGLLWIELNLMSHLWVELPSESPVSVDLGGLGPPGKGVLGKKTADRKVSSVPVG